MKKVLVLKVNRDQRDSDGSSLTCCAAPPFFMRIL